MEQRKSVVMFAGVLLVVLVVGFVSSVFSADITKPVWKDGKVSFEFIGKNKSSEVSYEVDYVLPNGKVVQSKSFNYPFSVYEFNVGDFVGDSYLLVKTIKHGLVDATDKYEIKRYDYKEVDTSEMYRELGEKDTKNINLDIHSLVADDFPKIVAYVGVDSAGEIPHTELEEADFTITENGTAVNLLGFQQPSGGNVKGADIVFCIDVSGSMSSSINAVANNASAFADTLNKMNVDWRLGLVTFGAPDPNYMPHRWGFTDNVGTFKSWVHSLQADGGTEPGHDAIINAARMGMRPGVSRAIIVITDEEHNGTGTSAQTTINVLKANAAVLYAAYSTGDYGNIAAATGGKSTSVGGNLVGFIYDILAGTAGSYVFVFNSPDPNVDGVKRVVEIVGNGYNGTASDTMSYRPGAAPKITLTDSTKNLIKNRQPAGVALNISANVEDIVPPGVSDVKLYFRKSGSGAGFGSIAMAVKGSVYRATIAAASVDSPGVDFYIEATDGERTSYLPAGDPQNHPFQIAIWPNEAPKITHTSPAFLPGAELNFNFNVDDNTDEVSKIVFHWRKLSEVVYHDENISVKGKGSYSFTLTGGDTGDGIEYCIIATDNYGVSGYWPGPGYSNTKILSTGAEKRIAVNDTLSLYAIIVDTTMNFPFPLPYTPDAIYYLNGNVNLNHALYFTGPIWAIDKPGGPNTGFNLIAASVGTYPYTNLNDPISTTILKALTIMTSGVTWIKIPEGIDQRKIVFSTVAQKLLFNIFKIKKGTWSPELIFTDYVDWAHNWTPAFRWEIPVVNGSSDNTIKKMNMTSNKGDVKIVLTAGPLVSEAKVEVDEISCSKFKLSDLNFYIGKDMANSYYFFGGQVNKIEPGGWGGEFKIGFDFRGKKVYEKLTAAPKGLTTIKGITDVKYMTKFTDKGLSDIRLREIFFGIHKRFSPGLQITAPPALAFLYVTRVGLGGGAIWDINGHLDTINLIGYLDLGAGPRFNDVPVPGMGNMDLQLLGTNNGYFFIAVSRTNPVFNMQGEMFFLSPSFLKVDARFRAATTGIDVNLAFKYPQGNSDIPLELNTVGKLHANLHRFSGALTAAAKIKDIVIDVPWPFPDITWKEVTLAKTRLITGTGRPPGDSYGGKSYFYFGASGSLVGVDLGSSVVIDNGGWGLMAPFSHINISAKAFGFELKKTITKKGYTEWGFSLYHENMTGAMFVFNSNNGDDIPDVTDLNTVRITAPDGKVLVPENIYQYRGDGDSSQVVVAFENALMGQYKVRVDNGKITSVAVSPLGARCEISKLECEVVGYNQIKINYDVSHLDGEAQITLGYDKDKLDFNGTDFVDIDLGNKRNKGTGSYIWNIPDSLLSGDYYIYAKLLDEASSNAAYCSDPVSVGNTAILATPEITELVVEDTLITVKWNYSGKNENGVEFFVNFYRKGTSDFPIVVNSNNYDDQELSFGLKSNVVSFTNPADSTLFPDRSGDMLLTPGHSYDVTIYAVDEAGNRSNESQPINFDFFVNSYNNYPQILTIPDKYAEVGKLYNCAINVFDADGDAVNLELVNPLYGIQLNGTNLQWTPDSARVVPVTMVANDGNGGTDTLKFTLVSKESNDLAYIETDKFYYFGTDAPMRVSISDIFNGSNEIHVHLSSNSDSDLDLVCSKTGFDGQYMGELRFNAVKDSRYPSLRVRNGDKIVVKYTSSKGDILTKEAYWFTDNGAPITVQGKGWHMMSVPVALNNPNTFNTYGNSVVFTYNEPLNMWQYPENIARGVGHIVYNTSGFIQIKADGDYVTTALNINLTKKGNSINAQSGWNLLGNPYSVPIDFDEIINQDATNSYDHTYWIWNAVENQYDFYPSPKLRGGRTKFIMPWEGFWMHAKKDSANVHFTYPTDPYMPRIVIDGKSKKATYFNKYEGTWGFRLGVQNGDKCDNNNFFGIKDNASIKYDNYDVIDLTPPSDKFVQLYFDNNNWDENSGFYAADYRPLDENNTAIWQFVVNGYNLDGEEYTLNWERLDEISKGDILILTDLETGANIDMLKNNSYTFDIHVNNKIVDNSLPNDKNANPIFNPTSPRKGNAQRRFTITLVKSTTDANDNLIPTAFALKQNIPNPFNPLTVISYNVPKRTNVKIAVYNVNGQVVKVLTDKVYDAGYYNIIWDSKDSNGNKVASGVYFYQMTAGDFTAKKKMIILK